MAGILPFVPPKPPSRSMCLGFLVASMLYLPSSSLPLPFMDILPSLKVIVASSPGLGNSLSPNFTDSSRQVPWILSLSFCPPASSAATPKIRASAARPKHFVFTTDTPLQRNCNRTPNPRASQGCQDGLRG